MYHKPKTRAHKKKKRFIGRVPTETQIDEDIVKKQRVRGGSVKNKLVKAKTANVLVNGAHMKCEITKVDDNPSSRDLTRRNIITKGAVLEVKTAEGKAIKAKVTSRPGQDGCINATKV